MNIMKGHFDVFRPWETEEVRSVRHHLLKCQQLAGMRAAQTRSENAALVFWMAADLAGKCAHASVPIERLEEDKRCLIRLLNAATNVEALEARP